MRRTSTSWTSLAWVLALKNSAWVRAMKLFFGQNSQRNKYCFVSQRKVERGLELIIPHQNAKTPVHKRFPTLHIRDGVWKKKAFDYRFWLILTFFSTNSTCFLKSLLVFWIFSGNLAHLRPRNVIVDAWSVWLQFVYSVQHKHLSIGFVLSKSSASPLNLAFHVVTMTVKSSCSGFLIFNLI